MPLKSDPATLGLELSIKSPFMPSYLSRYTRRLQTVCASRFLLTLNPALAL